MRADKIPDEIMREAREIANCFLYPGSDVANECAADIARALMARDKRAAEIARAFAQRGVMDCGYSSSYRTAAADVATAILTYGGRE